MTTTLTRKVVSGWAACLLTTMLVGCGGGGGDGESSNAALSPSVAASAAIGVAGGSLEATLAGGTTVRLTVPAGALKATTAFRIDPVPAAAGSLGTFELAPVGLEFKLPARLEITPRAATAINAETTLVFSLRGVQVPMAARVDSAARTVTVLLRRLGSGSPVAPAAASRVHALGVGNATVQEARRLDAAADAVQAALVLRNFLERASLLTQLLDRLTAQGTIDNAVDAQLGIESVLGLPQTGEVDRFARSSLAVYRTVVCGQREFSVSSLNTFQDGTDHAGFLRRASDVLQWGLLAEELAPIAAGFAPAETGCANLPPDRTRPVRDRFPGYLERVQSALALLDPKLDFTQILTVRMTALLAFAAGLQGSEVDDLASQVQSIAAAQTVRLRFGAYASCVADGSQIFQQTLLAREISDAAFLALSIFSESDLHSDIQYCGTTLTWEVQTASGAVVRNGTAGGLGVGLVRASMNVALDGGDKLVLRGPLNALRCPTGSQNNEQLAIGAGQGTGALTSLGLLTPSNANTYLQAAPLEIPVAQLRALTNAPAGSSAPGRLVLQRTGGVCNGEFPLLQNTAALVTLVFASAVAELSIFTANLPDATQGSAYATTLVALGGTAPYTWTATGLPAALPLNAQTGQILGTPTAAARAVISATVTDANGQTASRSLALRTFSVLVGRYFAQGQVPAVDPAALQAMCNAPPANSPALAFYIRSQRRVNDSPQWTVDVNETIDPGTLRLTFTYPVAPSFAASIEVTTQRVTDSDRITFDGTTNGLRSVGNLFETTRPVLTVAIGGAGLPTAGCFPYISGGAHSLDPIVLGPLRVNGLPTSEWGFSAVKVR